MTASAPITEPQQVLEEDIARGVDAAGPLAGHTARGAAWVAGARLAAQAAQFLSAIVLARLLVPDDYGLIAVTFAFTSFAWLLADLGLGAYLVQAARLTERDAATAFWLNAALGLLLTAIVAGLSTPIASLYGDLRLGPLLALSAVGFSMALSMVPIAILERRMRFQAIALIDVGSAVAGFAVSIACAAVGLGAVSLVIGPLVGTALTTIASFLLAGWYPKRAPSRESMGAMLRFGGHLTGFNVVNFWARNADSFLLGKFATEAALGLYNRAYMLMLMPVTQVGGVLGRVLLPVLARLKDDAPRLRAAYLRVCSTSGLIAFPVLLGLGACAPTFVPVMFGDRWDGMIPLLIVLALSGPPQVAAATAGIVCQATGQPRLLSTWGNLSSVTVVVAILMGLPWGAMGVAVAFAVRAYVLFPLSMMPAKKAIGVGSLEVAKACALPFIAATVMALVVVATDFGLAPWVPTGVVLVAQIGLGAAVFGAIVHSVDPSALPDLRRVLRRDQSALES